jgi:nicotinate phosphoribosyltransferase
MLSFAITGNYTDLYEVTMGQVYFNNGRAAIPACFDYFFRNVPSNGGYVLFAGLETLLDALEGLRFTETDIAFLRQQHFDADYLAFLEGFRFRGTIYSVTEGEVVFPRCPVIRVEGTLFETQLVETLVLNLLNFESLIATKASRIRRVAGHRGLSEFGLRRAHGPAGILATRAAIIGGFDSTSNVYAAERYGLVATGTMAHSFVESYPTELEAFRAFARSQPDNCIFLADTYNTLESGIPNAIRVAKEMEGSGQRAGGIRLDSGDLAYLAGKVRHLLDEAGLPYMKIVVSNQLDEFVVKSLLDQGAPVDVFGVGTHLVTGQPDAALDGVYKLCMSGGEPKLKISDSVGKVTLPGIKQVLRTFDGKGQFFGADAIILDGEAPVARMIHPVEPDKSIALGHLPQEPLLHMVMEKGKRLMPPSGIQAIKAYAAGRLGLLPAEYQRFVNPHTYKVGLSGTLLQLREKLRKEHNTAEHESLAADRYSK